jgi:hypothetical protein
MAFPHPKSRKGNYWNGDIPNNGSVVWKFLKRTINITDYRNGEDEVNPAKYGTFGGLFHGWFVNRKRARGERVDGKKIHAAESLIIAVSWIGWPGVIW